MECVGVVRGWEAVMELMVGLVWVEDLPRLILEESVDSACCVACWLLGTDCWDMV